MMERVHSRKVDATSKTYHGTWGYVHYLDPNTLASLDGIECTVPVFQQTLKLDFSNPVNSGDLIPDADEHQRWGLTLRNQVARVLLNYMKEPGKYQALPVLNLSAIDPIKAEKPNIDMLKLMDSSDNGSDGIASLYEELIDQTGLTPEAFSNRLQIIEGDLGTCLNFHGLERQRIPSKSPDEALSHLIMVPGAGHTLWNIAQAILLHHWGNPDDKDDLGAWRTAVELGADKAKPTAKKDFTSMIRLIEQIHEATITHCIFESLGLSVSSVQEPIEMTVETFNHTVETVYFTYFSGRALLNARLHKDSKQQQFFIRIRDFATVVEANRAMSDGDIGRLMLMWKRWSVMTQGLKGLTHYSRYLPRLIRLLTKVLPKPLAQVIMHSLLISPTGRPGHFVAKDFFLEVQNYWLKYFYNNAGPGTDIQRLKETFSLTIGLLAFLVEQMKGRAGQNQVRQSHKNKVTSTSIMRFLNMAKIEQISRPKANSNIASGAIPDVNLLGIHKLQDDYVKRRLERFHWPLSSNYDPPTVAEGEEADQEVEQREGFGEVDDELVRWITEELN
ncbi:hypothetical protein DFH28DRAFT_1018314 [Melampsora americana]|nr:hypothetical protein DFH28DRAFT_1044181 [Melampsora americana]KAH9823341.1 hypothetical protein DFH28DRAFT_1018314 [Melampsora americana]